MAAAKVVSGRASGRTWRAWTAACLGALAVAGCGGDGDRIGLSCSVADENVWLRGYMNDMYFWYAMSPDPDPAAYASVDAYFKARLFAGNATFPADRWSYDTSTDAFNLFYGAGQTLGWGVMVAGLEVAGQPGQPLYVRYVEPGSPGAAGGVVRGDQVLTVNGTPAATLIANDDYSALAASAGGQTLTLGLRNTAGDRTVTLTSAVYDLQPVTNVTLLNTPGGRKLGYVQVKDMVSPLASPVDAAFAQFKSAGVQDVVIDLRYNGGGLISAARGLASYPAGATTANQAYTRLLYNDQNTALNQTYAFNSYGNALGLSRVYVLTGQRTCSASEQLINGLRPYVTVVTVGDTTCGKPVGFQPQDDGCGTTWSIVNFESVNKNAEGRWFDGFEATCGVAEDWSKPLGSAAEPLLAAAMTHADTGACPTAQAQGGGGRSQALGLRATQRPHWLEPGDRRGMIAR